MYASRRGLLFLVYLLALVLSLLWLYDYASIEAAITALLIVSAIMGLVLRTQF